MAQTQCFTLKEQYEFDSAKSHETHIQTTAWTFFFILRKATKSYDFYFSSWYKFCLQCIHDLLWIAPMLPNAWLPRRRNKNMTAAPSIRTVAFMRRPFYIYFLWFSTSLVTVRFHGKARVLPAAVTVHSLLQYFLLTQIKYSRGIQTLSS